MDERRAIPAITLWPARVTDAADAFARLVEGQLDGAFRLSTVILGSSMEAEDAVADAALSPADAHPASSSPATARFASAV